MQAQPWARTSPPLCAILAILPLFFSCSVFAQNTVAITSGNWSDPATWNNGPPQPTFTRVDVQGPWTTTVDQDFSFGDPDTWFWAGDIGLIGPGFVGGPAWVDVNANLTVYGAIDCGVITGDTGTISINTGASLELLTNLESRFFLGSPKAGGNGTGHLICRAGSSLNVPVGWIVLGEDGTAGDSLTIEGTIEAGDLRYANQVRMHPGSRFIVRPSANGAAGLSPITTDNFLCSGNDTGAVPATNTTIVVDPSYAVSVGDSWEVIHYNFGLFNTFENVETVPPDLGVSVDYTGTPNSVIVTVTSLPSPPDAPTGLTAEAWSTNEIRLSWTDNSGTAFVLERGTDGVAYPDSFSIPLGTTNYNDNDEGDLLDPGVTYYYRLYATSPYGDSAAATAIEATGLEKYMAQSGEFSDAGTWEDGIVPEAQDHIVVDQYDLEITGAATVADMTGPGYTDDSSATITGSLTSRDAISVGHGEKLSETNPASKEGLLTLDGGTLTAPWLDLGRANSWEAAHERGRGILYVKPGSTLDLGTGYILCGHWADTGGTGKLIVEGDGSSFTFDQFRFTHSNPDENAFVVRPTGNGASGLSTLTGSGLFVNGGLAHLEVAPLYVPSVGDSWTIYTFSGYADTGTNGTQFAYVKTTPSDLAVSVSYNANDIVVEVTGAPATPANPASDLQLARFTGDEVELAWTDNGEEYGFLVERRVGPSGAWESIGELPGDTTIYTDSDGITPEGAYSYRVTALGAAGDAAPSAAADTVALPSNLAAAASGADQIDLAWTDNSGNEEGFVIERREDAADTAFAEVGAVGPDVTSYIDADAALQPSTSYIYRVRAYNSSGFAYSGTASAETDRALRVVLGDGTAPLMFVREGGSLILSVEALDAVGAVTYQWYKGTGGSALPVGADEAFLLIGDAVFSDSDVYWCECTAGIETAQSPEITVEVQPAVPLMGASGLLLLSGFVMAAGGALSLRRKKK